MASLVLAGVGAAIGGSIGGGILGVSAVAIGSAIGTLAGNVVDAWIVGQLTGGQRFEGQRLDSLRVTSSTEGTVLPRLFGRIRVGGNIIWATDFNETKSTSGGGKGLGGSSKTTEYTYSASFAVALCEGEITGIGRIWADGKPLDTSGVIMRWYPGSETQAADTLISNLMGSDGAPAYRGTAYVVFEDLDLTEFGNRIPQLTFEVYRPLADADTAEGTIKAVTMIPGAGEFVYATEPVTRNSGVGNKGTTAENVNAETERADMLVSLDRLEALVPAVESVSLVVSWFGDDLRAGDCLIKPGVENTSKTTSPLTWQVDGVSRPGAHVISTDSGGSPVFGGTPDDASVVQAIQEMKARGLKVTFYPFILMDIPDTNTLPNPYSDNAATNGQPKLPWRGRITCSPAAGYVGTVDKTASAASQVSAFFGSAQASDFTVSGESVSWSGGTDWGYRRMILHYAHLCAAAGGVDAFLIGSELVGLTTIRDSATTYPAVTALKQLAADVSAILGSSTKVSYAADWSEYFGHQPGDGTGDVFFHLDPLWADANIDFVGMDNYLPLSDWRDGFDHLDTQAGYPAVHDRAYLQAGIEGGERFDWYYASAADRDSQTRSAISDGAYSKPWVFRPKDIRRWWSNQHFDRPGGVESATPTAWVPESKPIVFTEYGCPAIDRGTNQPNVFYDPKSAESAVPWFSRGWRDDAIQRAYLEAVALYWGDATKNPTSSVYGAPMVDMGESAAWTWDARPHPFFPALTDVWTDGDNWQYGHWLTGRLGSVSLAALIRHLCKASGLADAQVDVSGIWGSVDGLAVTALESARTTLGMLARHFGFDAAESEGVIRFTMRGAAPVRTISASDLVAGDREDIERVRGQVTEMPQVLRWAVARADEDYDSAMVEARRVTTGSQRIAAENFPVVVPPEEAERRCRRALIEGWAAIERATFALPPSRMALDPGDPVKLDGAELRINRTALGEAIRIEAAGQDREAYDLPSGPARKPRVTRAVTLGPGQVAIMDLPRLNDQHTAPRPLVAVDADPWPGAVSVQRSPETSGWTQFATVSQRAMIGILKTDLPAGPVSIWDRGNVLDVEFSHGTLSSVTDLQLFAGANAFAVETPTGWEVVQGRDVTLVTTGRYQISTLLRGQRGTEWAMGMPTAAGARIVVLDGAITELLFSETDIGVDWNIAVGPSSKPISDASWTTKAVMPGGASLKPFAPAHAAAVADSTGDITLSWIRRSRDPVADSWEATEVPLLDTPEQYEIDILDGATVKRTLTSTTTSVTYNASDQTTDWGAPLAAGASLSLALYQLSPSYGRGFEARKTVVVQ